MLKLKWTSTTITTNKQANDMIALFNTLQPKIGGFDTEADGLHIILSTPFLFQFGFINPNMEEGYTYAVDIERQPNLAKQVIKTWNSLAESLDIYLAHNVKFDLHMLLNIGLPYTKESNLSDTMFYIRHAHDALTPDAGGPPLGLKAYAARYIDPHAKSHERLLTQEKSAIVKELHIKLKLRMKKYNMTMKKLADLFKDCTVDYNDLPPGLKECYLDWLQFDVPVWLQSKVTSLIDPGMIQYNILNRTNLTTYAHYDIIYLLEVFLLTDPVVKARGTQVGIDFENRLIMPLVEMERVGFKTDKTYVENCRVRLKEYIKERREVLYKLAGQQFSIGQHALVKEIFESKFNIPLISTNSTELDLLKSSLIQQNSITDAIEFIDVLQELRTLEKWYSVYVLRFLKDLQHTDRLYTTINQVGAVSGRVTSDFQQFPKKGIKTVSGEELFHPRRMVCVSGGEYDAISYLDYSQIELRFQALYTILVNHADLNLCRAYMPYQCINPQGVEFDYNNPEHVRNWAGEWYLKEDTNVHWTPTDVHGATTEKATGLTPEHPDFKSLRSSIGKRTNFAKNYGAKWNKIREMFPEKTEEEITRIDNAYYEAFPGVKSYHSYCYARAQEYSYTVNLFGVRYYGVSGHKLINMLVQGSAAYYLKWKIRELYDYCKANNIKSRWQMQIHDELSWEHHIDDPPEVFFKFQDIMQQWEDALVPVVADMEITTTTWADKTEIENITELRGILCKE